MGCSASTQAAVAHPPNSSSTQEQKAAGEAGSEQGGSHTEPHDTSSNASHANFSPTEKLEQGQSGVQNASPAEPPTEMIQDESIDRDCTTSGGKPESVAQEESDTAVVPADGATRHKAPPAAEFAAQGFAPDVGELSAGTDQGTVLSKLCPPVPYTEQRISQGESQTLIGIDALERILLPVHVGVTSTANAPGTQ